MRADPAALWTAYLTRRTQPGSTDIKAAPERNALIEHYLPLVRYVASKMPSNAVSTVERDDLISYGTFGLMDAIAKYDPAKGVKFETYAITRIRGSIIDEIRSLDWVPRSVRAKGRDVERAYAELEVRLGRPATTTELAEHLGLSMAETRNAITCAQITLINLEEHDDDDERVSERENLTDVTADPESVMLAEEISTMLVDALLQLPQRLKILLVLTYVHNMTLAQIGEVLGVTESRVSQLQSRMLQALRDAMSQELTMASTWTTSLPTPMPTTGAA